MPYSKDSRGWLFRISGTESSRELRYDKPQS
ncbi:hypothetical protein NPIL_406421, partial [Nephila pilipes]